MIFYLSKKHHQYTMRPRLRDLAMPLPLREELLRRLRLLSYEEAFRLDALPVGSYVFTDLDRLNPEQTERAAILWDALRSSGHGLELLNHPVRSMRRYELLRQLRERGINDFDVCRLTDRRPLRFPVFIRSENEHLGSVTPLLRSPGELEAAIEKLAADGMSREDKIIVEYRDVADARGLHHRYGAYIIGTRIFAGNLFFSRDWMVKRLQPEFAHGEFLAAEDQYVRTNPHEGMLRPIFTLARIEYGRMDYAMVDGRVQVFEINTNPIAPIVEELLPALRELDYSPRRAVRIPLRRRFEPPWEERVSWAFRVASAVHVLLRTCRLLALEPGAQSILRSIKRGLVKAPRSRKPTDGRGTVASR
jgi:hypothetical protein